jgi:hypothetical protein
MADDPGILGVCLGPSPNMVDDAVERGDRSEVEFRSVDPGVQGMCVAVAERRNDGPTIQLDDFVE